jgi:hypothetical protein
MENWNQWLHQFQIVEKVNSYGPTETLTASQFAQIEHAHGIQFPESYKCFCNVFGSCMFMYSSRRIYCPDLRISEVCLESLRMTLFKFEDSRRNYINSNPRAWGDIEDSKTIEKIKNLIKKSGFVFGDDSTAALFIFDTESYSDVDKSCDIWLGDGEGELDRFKYLGRSFYEFFLNFCINTEEDDYVSATSDHEVFVPQERQELLRFDSQIFHRDWLSLISD